mmetsp:Transcript_1900/g.4171  ORF Transcript_1900/g.4171 Transcript_1900/m.4171 type:complete len:350 (-) Transcript_1900:302-1351(-)
MSEEGPKKPPAKRKKKPVKYCKAPQAPKRFKSAFIFFTMDRHKVLRKKVEEDKGKGDRTPDVAKLISEEWRNLKPEERAVWDEKARLDKERFEVEKAMYTGPWKIPVKKKSQKDPNAPKRPMSSFLSYSNSKRAELKQKNPGLKNAEASKILAKMWHKASDEEKREHIEKEERLREVYKRDMAEWRAKKKKEHDEIRQTREEKAMDVVTGKTPYSYPPTAAAQPITPSNNNPGAPSWPHHQHYGYSNYPYQAPTMVTPAVATDLQQGGARNTSGYSSQAGEQGTGTNPHSLGGLPQPPMPPQGYGYTYPPPYGGGPNSYYPPQYYGGPFSATASAEPEESEQKHPETLP